MEIATFILSVISTIALVLMSPAMFAMNRRAKMIDDLKKRADRGEDRIKELADMRIDEKMRAFSADLKEIKDRIMDGDREFDEITNKNHGLELKFINDVHRLADWVRDHAASKEDLKSHENKVELRFGALEKSLFAGRGHGHA